METMTKTYLSDNEIKKELKRIEGLKIVEETKEYFEVIDKYGGYGRKIRFNKEEFVVDESMVESFGRDITELEIVDYLQSLPKILLMNINKVYIISSEDDVELLWSLSPNHTFSLNYCGLYVCEDGNIIISLPMHEELAEDLTRQDMTVDEFGDYEGNMKRLLWKTLAHCLYKSLQSNPLFENDVEQGEEAAHRFSEKLFEGV